MAEPRCGSIMVGSGTDAYDPTCDLPKGHVGVCASFGAIDQHRLRKRCEQCGRDGKRGFRIIAPARIGSYQATRPIVVCANPNACRKRWPKAGTDDE